MADHETLHRRVVRRLRGLDVAREHGELVTLPAIREQPSALRLDRARKLLYALFAPLPRFAGRGDDLFDLVVERLAAESVLRELLAILRMVLAQARSERQELGLAVLEFTGEPSNLFVFLYVGDVSGRLAGCDGLLRLLFFAARLAGALLGVEQLRRQSRELRVVRVQALVDRHDTSAALVLGRLVLRGL